MCTALVQEMSKSAKNQVPKSLNGRTISGMVFEMQAHYWGKFFYIKLNNTDVTHMGSNIKGSIGYGENDDWFEHPLKNLPHILRKLLSR